MSNAAHRRDQDDLRLLRESVRTLLERAGGAARARKIRDEDGVRDSPVMLELAKAGVFGAVVPEEAGGLGMGLSAAGIIAEEVGRVIAPEPVVASVGLAIGLLRRLCPEHALLAETLAGTTVLATAWQERDVKGLSNTLSCRFENSALTGTKSWVAGVTAASAILVVAEADGGPALALIEPCGKGVSIDKRRQSDGSIMAELHLSEAPAELLAKGPVVNAALAAAVSDTTALTAAELVGVSAKALEITLDYTKTREQFDKPIGSFQVIQHRAVDMHIMQQLAEASVRDALGLMDAAEAPRLRARQASRAKARACTTARKITREAIQLHGAIGYTDELDIGLYLNRALVLSAWLGDDVYHRRLWLRARNAEEAAR
ncbi:MAG: acyl-CoA dehydrogenase family protein [Alphaproteobacteria bacterium]|nr:acyl-CoA dehydrogenase family protein [Alphaproteobacteria bacterium]